MCREAWRKSRKSDQTHYSSTPTRLPNLRPAGSPHSLTPTNRSALGRPPAETDSAIGPRSSRARKQNRQHGQSEGPSLPKAHLPIGRRSRAGRNPRTAEFLNSKRPCRFETTDRASARGSIREDTSDPTSTRLERAARSHKSNIAEVLMVERNPDEAAGAHSPRGTRSGTECRVAPQIKARGAARSVQRTPMARSPCR